MASSGMARSKVALWVIAVSVLAILAVAGAGKAVADERSADALRAGSWSLQFGISSNFTLTSFEGVSISAKKHFSPSRAIRFGTTLSGYTEDVNTDRNQTSSYSTKADSDNNSFSWNISALYLLYPGTRNRLSLFTGFGPDFGYSRTKSTTNTTYFNEDSQAKTQAWSYSRDVYVGLRGVLGAEWFVAKRIGLIADYSLATRYIWEKGETLSQSGSGSSQSGTKTSKERFDLYSSAVQFGISVYF